MISTFVAGLAIACASVFGSPTERGSSMLCGTWALSNGGPDNACGYEYTYTALDDTSCAMSGSNCLDKCCSPNDAQLCDSWALGSGGPMNACGDWEYTATATQVCADSGDGCRDICCTESIYYGRRRSVAARAQPQWQLCGTWALRRGGPINSCGRGWDFTAYDGQVCRADNKGCRSTCCTEQIYY